MGGNRTASPVPVHSRMTRSSSRKAKGKGGDMTQTKNWMERRKRRKMNFKKRNIIGNNDLIVNTHLNKIKLEGMNNQQMATIKEEIDNLVESVDVEMEDIDLINEDDRRVKMEYAQVRVVTDDTESLILNEVATNDQDHSSSSNLQEVGQPEDRSDPANCAKTAEHLPETVYKAKFLSLRRRNQGFLRTLKQKNSVIRVLVEKIETLELQLFEATSKIKTIKNDGKTVMTVEVGTEEKKVLQSSVCHANPETSYESVSPGPLPAETIQNDPSRSRPISPNYSEKTEEVIRANVVKSKMNDNVFEQVVRFLIRKGRQIESDHVVSRADEIATLKKCRLVCKNWKESVDRELQNDPSHVTLCPNGNSSLFQFKKNFTPPGSTIILKDFSVNQQFTLDALSKLQNYAVEYLSFNPFPNGHLMIDVEYKISNDFFTFGEFWFPFANLVLDLLKTFGAQVFYLTLRFQLSVQDSLELRWGLDYMRESFVKWLNLTTNVKSLCMEFNAYDDVICAAQPSVSVLLFEQTVPHMKHLTVIQNSGGLVLYDILAKNEQINSLRLDGCVKDIEKIVALPLPNLSELVILPAKGKYFGRDFSKLTSVTWPLQRLSLICSESAYHYLYNTPVVLSPQIKSTLQYFSLEQSANNVLEDLDTQMDLPLLTHLRIKCDSPLYLPGKFESALKQLKLLEILEIEVITTGLQCNNHGFFKGTFSGLIERLGNAGYWNWLPKLKRTKVVYVVKGKETRMILKKIIERDELSDKRFFKYQIAST